MRRRCIVQAMLRGLLPRIEELVLRRPRAVLAGAALTCLLAGWLGSGIELRTSRREMVPKGDANQARWDALRREFNGPEPLIVALDAAEGTPIEQVERAADAIAEALREDASVSRVFHRVDLEWLTDHALYLAPPDKLESAFDQIERLLAPEGGPILLDGFARLDERLAARIEESLGEGSVLPSDDAAAAAERLLRLVRFERRFLEEPEQRVEAIGDSPLALVEPEERGSLTPAGYLATYDQRTLFVLVSERGDGSSLPLKRTLVAHTRAAVERVLAARPGIAYGLTGPPAMTVEEMAAIGRDGRRTSAVAVVGVYLLSLAAFRRRRHALLGLATLVCGVVWSLGAVRLELGYLNMITTALVPILVGMGIDYAIHPISQFELETRTLARAAAVRATFRKTAAAVVVSAATTAAAFFCFLFMQFRGFAELGLVTGVGVLLCLLAALLLLPALLVLFGGGGGRDAAVDRVWDLGAARRVCARPAPVLAVALVGTLAGAWLARGVELDSSLLELLPAGAESLRYLERVNEESALANNFNLVVADDLEALAALRERARREETIARFESILTFLPQDPDRSAAAVARAAALLDRIRVRDEPFDADALHTALRRLEAALAEAADAAFVTGLGELSGNLEQARAEAEAAAATLAAADAERIERIGRALHRLRAKLRDLLEQARVAARAPAPSLASLPAAIRDRYVTSRGRFLAYLYPDGDMYDPAFLAAFNAACRRVDAEAIGFPVLFEDHSNRITAGFETAFIAGALLVCLLLAIDLRGVRHALLAMVPVLLGVTWMLGLMRAFGLHFNFANLVAVPIVIGVGIDSGVHLVHRYRLERDCEIPVILAHTGRAILIASLTTMLGFGSLALATHRGMQSLGLLLLIGVGTNLVAAIVVLPCLLAWRRHGTDSRAARGYP